MITNNISTLKIHKLTQAQYDRELAAGRIDENALYLTPDEEIDLTPYMTKSNPTGSGTLTMDGDGSFSGSVSVESLQIGGATLNYDNTNKFLEFVFTSTTDEGTEEV